MCKLKNITLLVAFKDLLKEALDENMNNQSSSVIEYIGNFKISECENVSIYKFFFF